MAGSQEVKKMLKAKKIKFSEMADMLGMQNQSFLNKLYRNTWSVEEFYQIAKALGFKVVLTNGTDSSFELLDTSDEV